MGAAVSNEGQSVEPRGQYFEGEIESARDRFFVDAFAYGIEQGGHRSKAEFFQNSPGGRQFAAAEPDLLGCSFLCDQSHVQVCCVPCSIDLAGAAINRHVNMRRRRLTHQLASQALTLGTCDC